MDLQPFQALWDNGEKRWIHPNKQKINFYSNDLNHFSFTQPLELKNYVNFSRSQNWSMKINSDIYSDDKQYNITITFHYDIENGTIYETCKGLNWTTMSSTSPYMMIDRSKWACSNISTNKDVIELIDINVVCDGVNDCSNDADELVKMCKPDYTFFEIIMYTFLFFYIFLGSVAFCILHSTGVLPDEGNGSHPNNSSQSNKNEESNLTVDLLKVCWDWQYKNSNKQTKVLSHREVKIVRKIYTTCQSDKEKKLFLKVLSLIAVNHKMKYCTHLVFDLMVQIEMESHSLSSLWFEKGKDSYLSLFMKDAMERNSIITIIKNHMYQKFIVEKRVFIDIWYRMNMFLQVIKGIANLLLFHLDIIKDITALNVIRYTKNTLFNDEDLKTRFDSVGGMNFEVLIAYLSAVLFFSEVAIYIHIYNQRGIMKNMYNGRFNSLVLDGMLAVFPVQYVILKKTTIRMNIMRLNHHIKRLLNSKEATFPSYVTKEVLEAYQEMEQLQHQLYKINQIQCEMGILQSALEREPQTVVQICLFILMKKFKRIKLLFSAYIGIPVELVVGTSCLISIYSTSKSIYNYRHCQNWMTIPNFFGAVTQIMAIFFLVSSKLIFVSITLLNAYYLHTFVFLSNVFFICFYTKLTGQDEKINIFQVLKDGLIPVFYKSSRKFSQHPLIKCFLKFSQKHQMVHTVTLHCTTLLLYSYVGAILRFTMFPFNIKKDYQSNVEKDAMPPHHPNSTASSVTNENDSERMKSSWESLLIDNQIHNFPFYCVALYIISMIIFLTLSLLYHKCFNPKKNDLFDNLKQKSGINNIIRSHVNVHYDDDKEDHDETNSNDEVTKNVTGAVEENTTIQEALKGLFFLNNLGKMDKNNAETSGP